MKTENKKKTKELPKKIEQAKIILKMQMLSHQLQKNHKTNYICRQQNAKSTNLASYFLIKILDQYFYLQVVNDRQAHLTQVLETNQIKSN